MMSGIYFIQIVVTFFIKLQSKQVRSNIYSLINKMRAPPKRIKNINGEKDIDEKNDNNKGIVIYNISSSGNNEEKTEKSSHNLKEKNEKNTIRKEREKKIKNSISFNHLSTILILS